MSLYLLVVSCMLITIMYESQLTVAQEFVRVHDDWGSQNVKTGFVENGAHLPGRMSMTITRPDGSVVQPIRYLCTWLISGNAVVNDCDSHAFAGLAWGSTCEDRGNSVDAISADEKIAATSNVTTVGRRLLASVRGAQPSLSTTTLANALISQRSTSSLSSSRPGSEPTHIDDPSPDPDLEVGVFTATHSFVPVGCKIEFNSDCATPTQSSILYQNDRAYNNPTWTLNVLKVGSSCQLQVVSDPLW